MPWLENKGILSLDTLRPAIKPIPTLPNESLWNYYTRLCRIDDSVGYLWVCQVFDGLSLGLLRTQIHELFGWNGAIPTTQIVDGESREISVNAPSIFPGTVCEGNFT